MLFKDSIIPLFNSHSLSYSFYFVKCIVAGLTCASLILTGATAAYAEEAELTGFNAVRKRLHDADGELDKLVGVRTGAINRKLSSVDRLDDNDAQLALDE